MRVQAARAGGARRAGLGFRAATLTGVVVAAIVSLVAGAVFRLAPGGSTAAAPFLAAQPGSVPWDGRQRVNLLLIGTSAPAGRASTLMLLSFDPRTHRAGALSIPPNLWVTVPGYGQAPAGQAYTVGGPRLALRTVESVTNTVVPYYLVAGRAALIRWIDAFDGISRPVDGSGALPVPAGRSRLDGAAALRYLTGAPSGGLVIDRSTRQQALLAAVLQHILSAGYIARLGAVVAAVAPDVRTNFPFDGVPRLARSLSGLRAAQVLRGTVGLQNGTASGYVNGGRQLLLPDKQRIPALAHRLFPASSLRRLGALTVVNGSGIAGEAISLASWLRLARIRVAGVATARSSNVPRTAVVVNAGAGPRATLLARSVAALLQIPIRQGRIPGSRTGVTLILGANFQNPQQQ